MVDGDGRAIYPGFQFPQQPVVMMPGRQVVITVLVMTYDVDYDYGHDAWTSGYDGDYGHDVDYDAWT